MTNMTVRYIMTNEQYDFKINRSVPSEKEPYNMWSAKTLSARTCINFVFLGTHAHKIFKSQFSMQFSYFCVLLRWMSTLSREATLQFSFLPPFLNEQNLTGKNF